MDLVRIVFIKDGDSFGDFRVNFLGSSTIVLNLWFSVLISETVGILGPCIENLKFHFRIIFHAVIDPGEVIFRAIVGVTAPHHRIPLPGSNGSHANRLRLTL